MSGLAEQLLFEYNVWPVLAPIWRLFVTIRGGTRTTDILLLLIRRPSTWAVLSSSRVLRRHVSDLVLEARTRYDTESLRVTVKRSKKPVSVSTGWTVLVRFFLLFRLHYAHQRSSPQGRPSQPPGRPSCEHAMTPQGRISWCRNQNEVICDVIKIIIMIIILIPPSPGDLGTLPIVWYGICTDGLHQYSHVIR